ncbi:hypothetical protein GCM10010339_92380 [Streptomyces alanosinicus]|uniref:IS110 family transposase n=1 Tax=Streptomyces alanosinicus TaxID=68171 RepID=A0A919D9M2_9ACTN|nr:hypothetical protein GCM10010339_92380 [Streptomyces alanosinicus]
MPGMTQQSHPGHDATDQRDQVLLGVDTHKDVHVAAVITGTGLLLDTRGWARRVKAPCRSGTP